jgi:hypothetical protein
MSSEEVKKKRGRKKKVIDPLDTLNESGVTSNSVVPVATTVEKPKSRRGRKTKLVVNAYDVDSGMTNMSDDENIIVKLNIRSIDNVEMVKDNTSTISPNAYDAHNSFESTPQYLHYIDTPETENKDSISNTNAQTCSHSNDIKDLRVVELLKDFEMKNKMSEWPQSTSIACYWCCHQFNTVPFGIPVKYCNNQFHVFGCFCSLECAAAYNFNSKESNDEIWERYNLLNLLSRNLGYKPIVKQAPDKLSLKMFGGHLDIDTFRKYFDSKKILNINFPPMMTLTQQLEEINDCDIHSEYRFIPRPDERIDKYKEKLTLKRSKPLTNYKHTLDHMMNLKIQS